MLFDLISILFSCILSAVISKETCRVTPNVDLTFYGMAEGGNITAFPCGNKAGGTGSYYDPETFATSKSNLNFARCEIVYIPYFRKYFQYSDLCV